MDTTTTTTTTIQRRRTSSPAAIEKIASQRSLKKKLVTVLGYHFPLLLLLFSAFNQLVETAAAAETHLKPEAWTFLESYGYLPKTERSSGNLLGAEELTRAIKLMQKFAALPQTGQLDRRTLAKMAAPRCGLPDVIKPEMKKKMGNRTQRAKRFVLYGPKWQRMPITWCLIPPSNKELEAMAFRDFPRAFALWATASPRLRFEGQGLCSSSEQQQPRANIRIGFFSGAHGTCQSPSLAFDGPGTKLAHAFSPPKGDVHFDAAENWMGGAEDGISLLWTALHEFGHALGFAHNAIDRSIMFPYYQDHGDIAHFELPEVDKAGVRKLYGNDPQQQPPATEDVTPPPPPMKRPGNGVTPQSEKKEEEEEKEEMPCNMNIDAIASIRGEIFIFKGNVFWWLKSADLSLVRREPIRIAEYFQGFPETITKVDAVYERRTDQRILFFAGRQYYVFTANRLHQGPLPLTTLGLPSNLASVDAVTDWGHNGRAFLFSGSIYWRLDEAEERVELDYPRDMTVWRGVPLHLDGAFTWQFDSATYFFKGRRYWRFDNAAMHTEAGYPKRIDDYWFREFRCSSSSSSSRRGKSAQEDEESVDNLEWRRRQTSGAGGYFLAVWPLVPLWPLLALTVMSCAISIFGVLNI